MKALEKLLHKWDPMFEKGAKWEKFHPLYETMTTFAFTPKHVTKKGAHIRDGVDLKRTMFMVVIALIPCLLFGIYNTGHWHYEIQSYLPGSEFEAYRDYMTGFGDKVLYGLSRVLPLLVVSYGVGLAIEFVFGFLKGHSLHEGYLVSGMLIPLIMPVDVPLWMVGVATAFAVIIGKEVFGGTGMNILNVALTARAFLFFAYPTAMSGDKVWKGGTADVIAANNGMLPDGATGATALADLQAMKTNLTESASLLLEKFQAQYDPIDAFMGMIPGSVGETSTLAVLIGALILLATGVASWRIIVSFFAGGFLFGLLMNAIGGNAYFDMPAYYHLIIGGFAFGAVFMATDPVTAAQTSVGKLWYGFLAGGIAVLIRTLNPAYPEGVMLAILFMNVMAPIIDHYVIQANVKRRLKRLKTA
ncbi:Na+-transporting NADH:ubiquinone oxidoreductase subunit B [Lishizhenia tianjinensis]|uniref:Na(+)-translocating NADH-quinone reductase subunit B n=1 Tax=Lishizhenia tianjinensis TaxID=477690 RepID=A0A1I7AEF6_9FLAO|nr:NADH:ubiquinone reductase (Na(+)-transporting) subunit B [Lishizhenia tianjinensis]SFT73332.1 Na+-transporting NADH:ubiquinone oxidoreductase subunit B [Lishizhenia tianjinensis]